jgi:hypothetical protein
MKKPWKIGLSPHISLYSGFADPLSFSCKCGFQWVFQEKIAPCGHGSEGVVV